MPIVYFRNILLNERIKTYFTLSQWLAVCFPIWFVNPGSVTPQIISELSAYHLPGGGSLRGSRQFSLSCQVLWGGEMLLLYQGDFTLAMTHIANCSSAQLLGHAWNHPIRKGIPERLFLFCKFDAQIKGGKLQVCMPLLPFLMFAKTLLLCCSKSAREDWDPMSVSTWNPKDFSNGNSYMKSSDEFFFIQN